MPATGPGVQSVLAKREQELLAEWLKAQLASTGVRPDLMRESELREQSREFLTLLRTAVDQGRLMDLDGAEWTPVREFLGSISRTRAQQGFTPTETAMFVLSLKQALFVHLRNDLQGKADLLAEQMWAASTLIDRLGLFTMEAYQRTREEVILRQQQELMELSTPVVQLWTGILALPLIGTLDSERTQVVMENLLQRIVDTGSAIAILDITGVPTVDTLVAQHLLKTVAAARLMGADCIISGIRPQIAQTIVHLGVELGDVATKATLADAFGIALRRLGLTVARAAGG